MKKNSVIQNNNTEQTTKLKAFLKTNFRQARIKETVFVWVFLALPLLQFLIFYVGVNFNSIILSFQEYVTVKVDGEWRGEYVFLTENLFRNFENVISDLFNNIEMSLIVKNSFTAYLVLTCVGLPLNILFAYVIYKKIPAAGFFQAVLYLPHIINSVVISTMFYKFVSESLPNFCQYVLNIPFPNDIMNASDTAFFMNLFYAVWVGFGMQLILYSGAMGRIPDSLIEYGALEGISQFREFFQIILPLIYPTITVFLVTGIAGIFTNQLYLYNFYREGASAYIKTMGYELYIKIIGSHSTPYDYPYASAAGVMFTVLVAPITLLAKHLLEKYGPNVEF